MRRPGIEPGPPAWKAGILATELSTQLDSWATQHGYCLLQDKPTNKKVQFACFISSQFLWQLTESEAHW